MKKIGFNQAYLSGKEIKYIQDVLDKREISGDGYYTKKVSKFLEKEFNINKVLMTTSATHALEMAAKLIDLKAGDEVIMPSFTFSSTANAVLNENADVVFAKIKEKTFNLDPADFAAKISKKTKAVIPVHYAGVCCEMDQIKKIAADNDIYVIEDAAHAVNSFYKGQAAGTLGDFGCYSFHGSKNFVSGEGGSLLINSLNEEVIKKAEIIREKGTNRSQFRRGEINKYNWLGLGSSYLPSDILMAVLAAQLEKMEFITKKREEIFEFYKQNLNEFLKSDFLCSLPVIPEDRQSNYHIYFLRFKNKKIRDFVLKKLKSAGIEAAFHFQPLHLAPMGKKLGYQEQDLLLTEKIAASIIRLPIYPDLKKSELEYIVSNLRKIFLEIKTAGV